MFQKIILCLIFIFYIFSPANANPIPVFCVAGWLDKYPNWKNACKSVSYIQELEPSNGTLKSRYNLYDSYILELEPSNGTLKSRYNLYDSYILELEPSNGTLKKRFNLY